MINYIRKSLESLDRKISRGIYGYMVGKNNTCDLIRIYNEYSELFSNRIITGLRQLIQDNNEIEQLYKLYLSTYITYQRTLNKFDIKDVASFNNDKELINEIGYGSFPELFEYIYSLSIKNELDVIRYSLEKFHNDVLKSSVLYMLNIHFLKNIFKQLNLFDCTPAFQFTSGDIRNYTIVLKNFKEIRSVVYSVEDHARLDSVLHELGHNAFSNNISPKLNYEFTCAGDLSINEGYALILESLNSDKSYINYLQQQDIIIHKTDTLVSDKEIIENKINKLSVTLGLYQNYNDYDDNIDYDADLISLMYLKGYVFKYESLNLLKKRFGHDWFVDVHAIGIIRELMSYGYKFNIYELINLLKEKCL